jgi:hypothetical protein
VPRSASSLPRVLCLGAAFLTARLTLLVSALSGPPAVPVGTSAPGKPWLHQKPGTPLKKFDCNRFVRLSFNANPVCWAHRTRVLRPFSAVAPPCFRLKPLWDCLSLHGKLGREHFLTLRCLSNYLRTSVPGEPV